MRPVVVMAALALAACAVGPAEHVPVTAPSVPAPVVTRPGDASLFDSLAAAAAVAPPESLATAVTAGEAAPGFGWVDILRDTTLTALVRQALRNNRDLAMAMARIREYRAEESAARSALFPGVALNGSGSENRIVIGTSPPIKYNAIRATADMQWEVDFWGRLRRGLGAAEADVAARDADERATVLTLVSDIAESYLALLEAREDLSVSQQTLDSRRATLDLARQRYAQGVISELDVRQFEGDVAAAASSVAQFTRAAADQEHALSVLLGQPPGPIAAGGSLETAVAGLAVPDSIPSALLLRRPDVESAERALAAASDRIGAAQGELLPRVTITGEYGYQNPTLSQLFGSNHDIYSIEGGVFIPLALFGGGGRSDIAAARARADEARAGYEQSVLTAMGEAADALVGVRTGRDQLSAEAAQVTALQDAYALARRRYDAGISSYLEVLDAQRSLFAAQLALAGVRRQYLDASVQLYKALGGRWPSTP